MKEKTRILCIYRHLFLEPRGTALRIKSIISELCLNPELEVHTCSLDEVTQFGAPHLQITNNHFSDIKAISKYIEKHNIKVAVFHTLAAAYYLVPVKFLTKSKAKNIMEMHGFMEEEARLYGGISLFGYYRNKCLYAVVYVLCDLI